jgi:hypothetical protein
MARRQDATVPSRLDAPRRSVMDDPGAREAMDQLVASAPPATPAQIELVNRVFRRPDRERAAS